MKRSRRSVAWEHFDLKNDLVYCQHCEAVYKYNSATTQMMYHLNNAHPTLVRGGASCSRSQPSISTEELRCTTSRENYPTDLQVHRDGYATLKYC